MNSQEYLSEAEVPITFKTFHKRHEYPSPGALRKMVYERDVNGLKEAFLKVGRRRLVLPDTLFRLLKQKGSE